MITIKIIEKSLFLVIFGGPQETPILGLFWGSGTRGPPRLQKMLKDCAIEQFLDPWWRIRVLLDLLGSQIFDLRSLITLAPQGVFGFRYHDLWTWSSNELGSTKQTATKLTSKNGPNKKVWLMLKMICNYKKKWW